MTDLLYKICESHLDDILVYGKTKEELSTNLQSVTCRLEKFGMTINPEKVKIHMSQAQHVGYVVDRYGIYYYYYYY